MRYSRGELPRSNPSIRTPSRSPPSVTPPSAASARASSTSAAHQHPLVAGRERLADRRRRPDHVDHDAGRSGCRLVGSEGDVNVHAATLAVDVGRATLLPPSEPGDACLVLGVRPPHLRGVHDLRPGRDPLPGAREHRRGQGSRRQRTLQNIERAHASLAGPGHDGADRDQRGRSTSSPPRREAASTFPAGSCSRTGPCRVPRSRTATGGDSSTAMFLHGSILHLALQHARPLLARHDHRAGARDAPIPARLLRLGARRIGRSALVQLRRSPSRSGRPGRSSASSAHCSSSSTSRPAR